MRLKRFVICSLIVSFAICCGCQSDTRLSVNDLSGNDLSGTYQATMPYGQATLTLKSDGTYSQNFQYKSGRIVTNQGTWDKSFDTVCLNNALIIGENLGAPQYGLYREVIWGLVPKKRFGTLILEFQPDLNWFYKKVS